MIIMQFQPQHFERMSAALNKINELHKPQLITLPDGSWGKNCEHCDGWEYPCETIQAIIGEM